MRLPSRGELKSVQALTDIERKRLSIEARTPVVSRLVPFLACLVALWWAQAVLVPIVVSILLSYGLEPLVVRLETWRIKRAFAAPLLLITFVGLFGGVVYGLRGEATSFVDRIPGAIHTLSQTIEDVTNGAPGMLTRMKDAAHELEAASHEAAPDGVAAVRIEQPTFKWSDWLWQGSRSAAEFAGQMLAVLCLTYCLLVAGDVYKRRLVHLVPRLSDKKITVQILEEIDRQIERFLMARAAISVLVGLAVAITFHVAGMLEAGVWGVIAAILFVVPLVGPSLVFVLASLAAFVQFGSLGDAALIAALVLVIGVLEGNVLTPWLLSHVGQMSTAAVFVSLLFWGWIWGGWGLLLAVPITASVKAVCERVPDLNTFAEILRA